VTQSLLIRSEPINTQIKGAHAWKVWYLTNDVNDISHESTGIIVAPTVEAINRPILSWAHGTTGLGDAACPSEQPDSARELITYFDLEATEQIDFGVPGLQSMIDAGYVVVATAYQGLGTKGMHQYMVNRTNARDAVFIARAATEIPELNVGTKLTCVGWSQGGGSAAAVAELDPADFGDLKLLGCVLLSPGALVPVLAHPTGIEGAISNANLVPDSHLLMTLTAHAHAFDKLNMTDVFTPVGSELMNKIWNTQPGHHIGDTAKRTFNLRGALLRSDPQNKAEWELAFAKGSAGMQKPNCPLLVCIDGYKGGTVITVDQQQAYIDAVTKLGAQVEVKQYPDDDHFSLPKNAVPHFLTWVSERYKD
jgi:dienelactone hydrolase